MLTKILPGNFPSGDPMDEHSHTVMHMRVGHYVTTNVAEEVVKAFVPPTLPLAPPLQLTNEDYELLEKANRALGRLDGITALLPNMSLFIYRYVRKEALLSSQIEGTQSSLSDLLLSEGTEPLK